MKEFTLLQEFIVSTESDEAKREELLAALINYGMTEYQDGYSAAKSHFDKD